MVIARETTGKHRTIKTRINYVLFALFLITPFIRIGEIPLVLLDIPERTFHIFGLTIWPQELYFLHMLLIAMGLMLFFFTALSGRIWCGYACPQTIFTEAYNWTGRLVAGKSYGRPTMSKADWAKVIVVWFFQSLLFSFVFLAYFMPYEEILAKLAAGQIFAHEGSLVPSFWLVFLSASTAVAFFNMVYYRENLCKLICPYGRFQTALLDKHSPIVAYDVNRGEPRREKGQKLGQHDGDCIDCGLCNVVCPTGIDIREGLQIGCISCGLCVDACTDILAKYNKKTLIDYRTIAQANDPAAPRKYLTARTGIYGALLVIVIGIFGTLLYSRIPLHATAVRDKNLTNLYIPTVGYQNVYEIRVANMSYNEITVSVELENGGEEFEVISASDTYTLASTEYGAYRFIVRYPAESDDHSSADLKKLRFRVQNVENPQHVTYATSVFSFPGPRKGGS